MTAPQQRAGGLDANARGILVLGVAVVIGLLLLWKGGDDGNAGTNVTAGTATTTTVDTSGVGSGDANASTEPAGGAGSSTTTTAAKAGRKPGEVNALVLNNGGPSGAARIGTQIFAAKGYKMGKAADGTGAELAKTTVFYAEGFQTEATAAASVIGKAPDVVQPMPDPLPGPGADAADVVIVIGQDAPPVDPSAFTGSTTTAAN